ncbi:hypothetical protein MMC13_000839 [Lambiella insularis]|nr:hypothetical protein [Lambiella insularis]
MELELPYLSSYLKIPETSLTTVLNSPTTELVRNLLEKVATKAREHEQVRSEKLRGDIELENVVRTAESKARVLKSSVEKGLKDVANVRQSLQVEETSRQTLESELQSLKSSTTASASEISTLNARITSLKSSNRDTLSILEAKSVAYNDLTAELSAKHQKTIELRHELSTLEQTLRSSNAASSTAKFREQSLQSEIDSLKRNNEWLEQELKTKSAEHTKFRKDKNSRIAELQREFEQATTTAEALQRSENTLKTKLEEVNSKADDFLNQIQHLQDDASRAEENFRTELDTAKRLTTLLEKSVNTERGRQQELSAQLEKVKEDATEELGRINAELETEHEDKEAAERRVNELEVQIERLEADNALHEKFNTRPGTPNPRINGHSLGTPGRDESPSRAFSPSLSRARGGMSMTQMITDYHSAKAEVEVEKRRNEKLSATIDEMIQEMELRQPEVAELQADHDRLEADVVEMSALVDNVGNERDQAKKDAREWEGQVSGLIRESDILRQQLRDLSSQVKVLLMEVHTRSQGLDGFTYEERLRLEQLARGSNEEEMSEDVTATDQFIAKHLTTFKSVADLQEQNTKLLRIAHELGYKLEGEEAQRDKTQASQNQEELEDLRQRYERCRDEIKSLVTQSQSYIRERDMFRRMLTHRGQLPPGSDLASLFGDSVNGGPNPGTPSRNNFQSSIEHSPGSKDAADFAKVAKEMQSSYDAYRQEAAAERSRLKEEVDGLSKRNSELTGEISRKKNEVTLAHERYEMLQSNYTMLRGENAELQKRSQALSDRAAMQDLRTQQVAEDLVETKGLLESMRNETANLKAEKDFWRSVEKRLTDDIQHLTLERERLNTLNTDFQSLLNEREQSDKDIRRRLQAQVDTMESELQATKRKLNDEVEDGKRAAARREFENKQSQARIDDLVTSLGSVREELVGAKTARDHLQARVDETTVELRSAEEKLEVLRQSSTQSATEFESGRDTDTNREQELGTQISEIKRDLELTRHELANAKAQVDQYKAISQSAEEELQSLNETQDQYRQEMDNIIEEREGRLRVLEQELQKSHSLQDSANNELTALRTEIAANKSSADERNSALEAEILTLKDSEERFKSTMEFYKQDLKRQSELTAEAQQNYETELVKHAEAAKNIQKVRTEYNELRLEVLELKTESESAKRTLSQNEESWAESKDRYEREVSEIKARRDDISAQNRILHQQLETVSSQIASLQQKRAFDTEGDVDDSVPATDNMQELVRYLRREKEIVDVQWELSTQETKRLRQQLEHTQSQLDDARLKLNQLRRAEEDSERNTLNHNKLMETINELNLNRESNVALRLEKNQAQAALVEKLQFIEELQGQIQPLQTKVRDLEDAQEAQKEELRMTREARERFEQRYHDILHRTDAIDPAEVENLKEQVASLRSERDELVVSRQGLQEQVDSIPEQIKQTQDQATERFQEVRSKLIEQSKAKAREQATKIREKEAALQSVTHDKEDLEKRLQVIEPELEVARLARDEALAAQKAATSEGSKEGQHGGSEDGQVNEEETPSSHDADLLALQTRLGEAESKLDKGSRKSTELQGEVDSARLKVSEFEAEVTSLRESLERANADVSRLQALQQEQQQQQSSAPLPDNDSIDQLEKLRQDLASARSDADALRVSASVNSFVADVQTQDDAPSVAQQMAAQIEEIRAELTARHDERVRQAEETFQKRTVLMKAQLSKRLADGKGQIRQQVTEELKAQHQEEMEALQTRHREELDELRRHQNALVEQQPQGEASGVAPAGASDASTANGESQVKTKPENWDPTEAEIKDLIQNNERVKTIIKNSIKNNISKEVAKVQEEQIKAMNEKLTEADLKANQIRDQAVVMEGKKYNAKVSMAENRARGALAKIDYVQKAAVETPEKPVSEVWSIAKDVKPAPIVLQQPQIIPAQAHGIPVMNPFAKLPPIGLTQQFKPTSSAPIPGELFNAQIPNGMFVTPSSSPFAPTPNEEQTPKSIVNPSEGPQPTTTSAPPTDNTDASSQPSSTPNGKQSQEIGQTTSKVPDRVPQGPGSQRNNSGTAPAAMKNLQQSSLPLPSGGRGGSGQAASLSEGAPGPQQQRGGAVGGRGRGRGAGRGGIPQVQTSVANNAPNAHGSPRGGPMSATAKQFIPQANKRPRDDGLEASQHASGAKRVRGGSQGN